MSTPAVLPPQVDAKPQNRPEPAKPKQPWLWNVVLLDDDHHSYEYVIRMVQTIFAHGPEKAFTVAKTVDSQGRAVCLTTHKEHAELKLEQIHSFGRDPLMAVSKGSMSAVIEPAWGEGDDANPADNSANNSSGDASKR